MLACQALAAASSTSSSSAAPVSPHPRKRARSSSPEGGADPAAARPSPLLLAQNAQRMLALADQGLAVVREMMALEAATRAAAGLECWLCAPEDHHTLEDACVALGTARHRAAQAV